MQNTNQEIDARKYMELAVEIMHRSINEKRGDKVSPHVGAVMILPTGEIETAFRGELSDGDHAEYTLLERKLVSDDLAGATLFCTLEPCAPGARSEKKTACAERIVSRRISTVWVGIEDPDPLVDSRGIKYLQENGVNLELFDPDLQEKIRKANTDFIKGAEKRASQAKEDPIDNPSELEKPLIEATLDDLSKGEVEEFIRSVHDFTFEFGSEEFVKAFNQLRYTAKVDNEVHPTGLGILLFGNNPQIFFPQAVIRATYRSSGRNEDITTFTGSLPKQAEDCDKWFKRMIGKQGDRSNAKRIDVYDFPTDVIRESVNNALAHRSYDIHGAAVSIEISDDFIVVKSPGGPVKPLSIERIKSFNVPYISKNPKITYAFEKLDLSESRGLGFETIRSLPTVHNFPLPQITFDDPMLIFTYSRAYGNVGSYNGVLDNLSAKEAKGYDFIRLNSPASRKFYEEQLGVSEKTANRQIARLVALGLVKKIGSGTKIEYEST